MDYYLNKLFALLIIVVFNVALTLLGMAILRPIRKKTLTLMCILFGFGVGSGVFGTLVFFTGATLGISTQMIYALLGILTVVALTELIRSQKDIKEFFISLINSKISTIEFLLLGILGFLIIHSLYRGLWPDAEFDSTWYHLTEPKIYLLREKISYIKGGLLYYSVMPQLTEALYLIGLFIKSSITAKLIHTFFGIWCAITAFAWGKRLCGSVTAGLIAALLFYSSEVVLWESQTAYIDLATTFYTSLGIWMFMEGMHGSRKDLFVSSIFIGLSIATKLLSIYWVPIFCIALIYNRREDIFTNRKKLFTDLLIIGIIPVLIWIPWGIYSCINTGNPVFPLAEGLFNGNDWFSSSQLGGLDTKSWIIERLKYLFVFPARMMINDYIFSPLLILGFLVCVLQNLRRRDFQIVGIIAFGFTALWIFTPASGGRFFLPVTIILAVYAAKFIFSPFASEWGKFAQATAIIIVIVNTVLQFVNYYKIFFPKPFIYSKSTEERFMLQNVSMNMWSFYDYNGKVKEIVGDKKVLTHNIHNLFYVDLNFEDYSYSTLATELADSEDKLFYLRKNYGYVLLKVRIPDKITAGVNFCKEIGLNECPLTLVYEDKIGEIGLYETK